ncbi:PE-PGRS family protein [Arundinibacter roseus]|uniref:PE-PGRS family protein n=1 Tax=Arundinibacter roseus TaxID=2070510 RepID=A0A4R4KI75_9BACT|nr:PE-PGRS family protein [Arundinibacter roseus]TDB67834.1 PE-PGRS family protein [Arundinibacter roseus]
MKSCRKFSLIAILAFIFYCCGEKNPLKPGAGGGRSDSFATVPQRFPITPGQIDEASGLTDSRTINGYLWTHQDAGSVTKLYLIKHDGTDIRSYIPTGITNRDWEDIAVGAGPTEGVSYLYVGDIGNNDSNPGVTSQFIYRMPELTSLDGQFNAASIDRITYQYPDSPRDAETLLFDPLTKDLFIVSKELTQTNLYRLPYPQAIEGVMRAELIGRIPTVLLATGGDISADGKEIIVRTYSAIYYWKRPEGQSIGEVLTKNPDKMLPYELEPQGEAVCFDKEMNGYFTISERRNAPSVTLNYYKRQ